MLAEVAEIYLQNEEDAVEIKKTTTWKTITQHLTLFDSVAAKTLRYRPLIEKASQLLLGGG